MRNNKFRYLIVLCIFYLAYSALYIARLNFSVASVLMEKNRILVKNQIGVIGSIFSFVFAITKIPAGILGDRISPRNMIITGLLLAAAGNLLIGWTARFDVIAAAWGINACGQALLWGPMLRDLVDRFGKERGQTGGQFLVSSTAFGSILGLWLSGITAETWGLAACFIIPSLFAVVMAALVLCLPWHTNTNQTSERQLQSFGKSLKILVKNTQFRMNLWPALAHGIIKDNLNIWMALYFVDTYGIDLKRTAGFVFFLPLMSLIGRLLFPLCCRIIKSAKKVCTLSFVLCTVLLIMLVLGPGQPLYALFCLGSISAMIALINTYLLVSPARYADTGQVALATGLMDTLTYCGAGLGSMCFGSLISQFGYNAMFFAWVFASVTSFAVLSGRFQRSHTNYHQ